MTSVLGQSLTLAVGGVVIGLGGTAALDTSLRGLLYGVTPLDMPTLAISAIVFLLTAAAASYVPARKAMRVDPLMAIRCE